VAPERVGFTLRASPPLRGSLARDRNLQRKIFYLQQFGREDRYSGPLTSPTH